MKNLAFFMLVLLVIPAVYGGGGSEAQTEGIAPATNAATYPTPQITFYAFYPFGTRNFTTYFDPTMPGAWTEPENLLAGDELVPFYAHFNWTDVPLGIIDTHVCVHRCSECNGTLCACVDECSNTRVTNPPRLNTTISNITGSDTNFTIYIENPTAGNITKQTNITVLYAGIELITFDVGTFDLPAHTAITHNVPWPAGPYTVIANTTFHSDDYNSSQEFYSGDSADLTIGSEKTDITMTADAGNINITVDNPTGFNFTVNVSVEILQLNWTNSTLVYLQPFAGENVSFTWTPPDYGTYTITAGTGYNSTSTNVTIAAPPATPSAPTPGGVTATTGGGGGLRTENTTNVTQITERIPSPQSPPLNINYCDGPTDWSACSYGKQTRTVYRYFKSEDRCKPLTEEKDCKWFEAVTGAFAGAGNVSGGQLLVLTFATLSSIAAAIGIKKFLF